MIERGIKIGVWIAGVIQTVVVILQHIHIIPSFSAWFAVSGTLYNPAHAAAHIVLAMAVATAWLFFEFDGRRQWIIIPTIVCGFASLLICGARSCILAYSIVLAFCINGRCWDKVSSSWKKAFLSCTIVSIVAIVAGMYFLRPASADSRLLTWRVCWDIFVDSPIFGIGSGNLKYRYMFAQAEYFSLHPNSPFIHVADNCFQSYNELIHLICEHGLVGFALCSTLAIIMYQHADMTSRSIIIAWLTVSMFLYASDIRSIAVILHLMVLNILISCISMRSKNRLISVLICITVAIAPLWPMIRIIITQESREYKTVPIPTYESTCDEGLVYLKAGDYSRAEEFFQLSKNMIPDRIYAPYCLFQLYVETEDGRAEDIAMEILKAEPRIYGDATIMIKNTVREWLEHCSADNGETNSEEQPKY